MSRSRWIKKIRKEIAFFYDDLEAIIDDKAFKKEFGELDNDDANKLKTAPKGYDPNHPAIDFLKLKSFTCSHPIDEKLFFEKDFGKKIAEKLIAIKPLNEFLNRALETEE